MDRPDRTRPHAVPVRRQRVGVYVVCRRGAEVLLTQLSARTGWPGTWTLPGGGVEHGEDPRDALVREVREETGLDLEVGALLEVQSVHFTGHAPDGTLEDYHRVGLVFAGEVPAGGVPAVQEGDASTAAAAWHPVAQVDGGQVPVVPLVRVGLDAARARGL